MTDVIPYLPLLLEGLWTTVVVTVAGSALALVIAAALGIARTARAAWLRWPAGFLVEVFRGTSLLVLMFWLFFALPFLGVEFPPFAAGILALGLNGGAYAAEVVRGAIKTRPRGQSEAAVALGLSPTVTLWRVLVPQAIPAMLPSLGNVLVDMLKASSLVSLVTITDLTFRAQVVRAATGETTVIFGLVLLMYYVLALACGWLVRWLERRFDVTRPVGRGSFLLRSRRASAGRTVSA